MKDELYRQKIDTLISEARGDVMLNGSHNHASIILERMFARADSHVRILTRYLDPRIYFDPEALAAARLFVGNPERKISILVEESDIETLKNLALLGGRPNVEVRQVPDFLRTPVRINFALMDESGYRLERDESGTSAVVSFGDTSLTPRLKPLFDKLWKVSQDIAGQVKSVGDINLDHSGLRI